MPTTPPVNIRGVDPELWLELRLEATRRRVHVGVLLNELLRDWLERKAAAERSREQPKGEPSAATY